MAYKYLVISKSNTTAVQAGKEVEEALWNISFPLYEPYRQAHDVTKRIFPVHINDTWVAMQYDPDYVVPLVTHDPNGNVYSGVVEGIETLITKRYGTLTPARTTTIKNFVLNNDSATMEQILDVENTRGWGPLPAAVTVMTQTEFDNLWAGN